MRHVQGQGRVLLRTWAELPVVVEGQVVPDVAAINDDRQVHLLRVVVGGRRQLDRRAQVLELGGRVALEERQRRLRVGEAELLNRQLRVFVDQVAAGFFAAGAVLDDGRPPTTRSRSARTRPS